MKQIVDKLNKIAKKIDENVDIPNTDLITDSLDAITTALGGTPNDSNLIVDKLEDIAGVAHGGGGGTEINNPILTINVDASGVVGEIGSIPLIQFNDGTLQNIHSTVNGGSTYTFECYVLEDAYEGEESEYIWYCNQYNSVLGTNKTLSVSNEVNVTVTLDQGDEIFYAIITDPTEPASFTLTVS